MTVGPVRGIVFSSVDPWNSTVTVSRLWKYGTNPEMTGYDFGDTYNGFAWVEVGGAGTS